MLTVSVTQLYLNISTQKCRMEAEKIHIFGNSIITTLLSAILSCRLPVGWKLRHCFSGVLL
jgi:hypothetical protein